MAITRFKALELAQSRANTHVKLPTEKVTDYYGSMTFNDEVMRSLLSPEAYLKINTAINSGTKIDRDAADEVAAAMKSWAISKGATHYTHWFQPLTGTTAEKHDSFFDIDLSTGKAVEKFKGSALVQQEPDASSFPNGGIRSTFEARGYTGWDPSSPAFIMENAAGTATLCIPSVFVSYTGEALDYKTPLLKSIELVDKAATAVIKDFFNRDINKVIPTLGAEQEYFVIDEALFNARPDLMMAGRTVFGRTCRGGGADDEALVEARKLLRHDPALDDVEALFLGQRNHRLAGDAVEEAVGDRRMDGAVAREEDVGAGAFGHAALPVQHHGVGIALLLRLVLGNGADHVEAGGLGMNRRAGGVRAAIVGDVELDALHLGLGVEHRGPRPGGDRHVDLVVLG